MDRSTSNTPAFQPAIAPKERLAGQAERSLSAWLGFFLQPFAGRVGKKFFLQAFKNSTIGIGATGNFK